MASRQQQQRGRRTRQPHRYIASLATPGTCMLCPLPEMNSVHAGMHAWAPEVDHARRAAASLQAA